MDQSDVCFAVGATSLNCLALQRISPWPRAEGAHDRDTSFAARARGLTNFGFMSNARWDQGGSTLSIEGGEKLKFDRREKLDFKWREKLNLVGEKMEKK